MTDAIKSLGLEPALHTYLVEHGTPPDAIQEELIETTRQLGGVSRMQIAPEQGAFMTLMVRALGVKRAIEIGTFTGYSALCIARGLPDDGQLLCCDVSDEWTAVGRQAWEKAGVADRISLRIGPAAETLASLPEQETFDLAFIDADKTGYAGYVDALHPRLRTGGLILVDNVLWHGAVIREDAQDPDTLAIRAFNDRCRDDERFDCAMIPVSDGLTLLRKR